MHHCALKSGLKVTGASGGGREKGLALAVPVHRVGKRDSETLDEYGTQHLIIIAVATVKISASA